MSREFLSQLAERVIIPDIRDGKYNPIHATSEDLVDTYHRVIGFLNSEEWDELADIVFQWSGSQGNHHLKRDQLYEELVSKLMVLPSYDTVEQKLGHEVAETFLNCQEEMDFIPWRECNENEKKFTKRELGNIVQLVAIASSGERERIISEYETFKRKKRQENQEKRDRIKDLNQSLIDRVKDLNVWFPYPTDKEKWLQDSRTQDVGVQFLELVDQIKTLMKRQRCLLQYIPKKRLTPRTVTDLDRNMEAMSIYLTNYLQ